MKISNIALAALLTVSSVQAYSGQNATQVSDVTTPQQLLALQYGELQDLESKLSEIEKTKKTTRTVLYVSGGAATLGALLTSVAVIGGVTEVVVGVVSNSVQRGSFNGSGGSVFDMAKLGSVLFVGGAAGAAGSTGYLVYLNLTQTKQLKKEISKQKQAIEITLQQLQ